MGAAPDTELNSLEDYIESLQASGRYTFTRDEAIKTLKITPNAFLKAKLRLEEKKKLATPKTGFYVLVPLEYKSSGAPPASWFIDDLMKYLKQDYYVGLLSAAALHGASHQAPQEFQVVTRIPTRPIEIGNQRIHFYMKKNFPKEAFAPTKTSTGFMRVSTPEMTAFDLIRYQKDAGYLSNVATVFSELSEKLDPKKIVALARQEENEISLSQRLGYLLEQTGQPSLAKALHVWLEKQEYFPVPLQPGIKTKGSKKNERWEILVNEEIEVDR